MEFTVPQFIEREPKIVGPFSFKQFVFVFLGGGFTLFLYFTLGKNHFGLWVFSAVFFVGGALALAFLKIEKTPLPVYIKNMVLFIFGPKIFLWKKKAVVPKLFQENKKIEEKPEEAKKTTEELKISEKSNLKKLFTKITTKK